MCQAAVKRRVVARVTRPRMEALAMPPGIPEAKATRTTAMTRTIALAVHRSPNKCRPRNQHKRSIRALSAVRKLAERSSQHGCAYAVRLGLDSVLGAATGASQVRLSAGSRSAGRTGGI